MVQQQSNGQHMKLTCTEFQSGGTIPDRFSSYGVGISPPFQWTNPPAGTQSFALICEDPDAPHGTFFHWAVYNIPSDVDFLPENGSLTLANSDDIYQGISDAGTPGYFGPKPPGTEKHRYRFRLFALNKKVNLPAGINDRDVLKRIQPYVIEEADLTGLFGRRH